MAHSATTPRSLYKGSTLNSQGALTLLTLILMLSLDLNILLATPLNVWSYMHRKQCCLKQWWNMVNFVSFLALYFIIQKSLHGIFYEIYHCNMGIQRHFTYIVELKDIFYDRIDQYIVLKMAMFCCIIELEKKNKVHVKYRYRYKGLHKMNCYIVLSFY